MRVEDGEMFRKLLKKRGYSFGALAAKVQCSRPMISQLALGTRTCSPNLAHLISEALGVPLELIFLIESSVNGRRSSVNSESRRAA